jgi:tripartite-type tricarboxylate transporter receptor subunit TctC
MNMRALFGGVVLAACVSHSAMAQSYPTRYVRIISPLPAGGPVDALARTIGQALTEELGQPFVIENRPGANTLVAAKAAADAPADGYTLMMGTDATLSINPHLYRRLPYNADDFVGITQSVSQRSHLFINADVPVHSVREFIAYAKSRPGQLNYGTYGHGSNPHLAAVRFTRAVGIDLVHVPFKGSQDSMLAFAGNQVQMMISSVGSAIPLVRAGKIRPLAVSGDRRPAELPDTPTFAEAGFPDLSFQSWFGVVARRGTPEPIINLLAKHLMAFAGTPRFNDVASRYAWEVVASNPQEFDAFLERDRQMYGQLIKEARIDPIE